MIFSNQGKATRIIGETLMAFWSHPWTSWKDISKEDENRIFDHFKEKLVEYWNTDNWKAKSSINTGNRGNLIGGKHTLGSQTYVMLKRKADKLLGRPATVDEIWMQSHGKKGTRPLDKLLISKGGERSQEAGNLDEIDLQTTVKWVDTRAKDSLVHRLRQQMNRYKG
ncbi:hypothetical protein R6Q57_001670 [Mikania cordata]